MKKLIAPAFCLSLLFVSATTVAANEFSTVISSVIENEGDRQPVKPEELPESIKKTLATDDYKGWAVKDAALVNNKPAADATAAAASYYEVTLTKGTESKTFKFHQDGTAVK